MYEIADSYGIYNWSLSLNQALHMITGGLPIRLKPKGGFQSYPPNLNFSDRYLRNLPNRTEQKNSPFMIFFS